MSITASWLVLAIVILQLVFKKAPKAMWCLLWGMVALRLICPWSFESVLSLIPRTEALSVEIIQSHTSAIDTVLPSLNPAMNPAVQEGLELEAGVNSVQTALGALSGIWLMGAAFMVLYTLVSYFQIRSRVKEAVPLSGNILTCDHIQTPFILGSLRPRIYLPSDLPETDFPYVLAHEQAHLRRKDHWWKPLGFLLLALYWFNPVLWVAYILLCRDIEMACDEKVLRILGIGQKKAYSAALINCSVSRKTIAACPLAFGEVSVKERVKTVLNYKKPTLWVILIAVVLCAVLALCFLSNPKEEPMEQPESTTEPADADGLQCNIEILGPNCILATLMSETEASYKITTFTLEQWKDEQWTEFESDSGLTSEKVENATDAKGLFWMDALPIGHYRVTVEARERMAGGGLGHAVLFPKEFDIIAETEVPSIRLDPLEYLPKEYSLRDAGMDGVLVLSGGTVLYNEVVWEHFLNNAESGEHTGIRIAASEDGDKNSAAQHVMDLVAQDGKYRLCELVDGEKIVRNYEYIHRVDVRTADGGKAYAYILTNSAEAPTEDSLYDANVGQIVFQKIVKPKTES